MSPGLSHKEFILMQKFIEENCGISLTEDKAYLIESRLAKILVDLNVNNFEELYERISTKNDRMMTEKIIDAITTNETLWFRDRSPWTVFEEILLPRYVNEIREGKRHKVRIWSAACSTGQEPYSTAMCIDHYLNRNGIHDIKLSQFEIVATDISRAVLQVAKMGRYDNVSIMRGLDDHYRDKYFKSEGRVWCLDERIKNAVKFQSFNLQNSFLILGKFDVVFCRYVVIYFSEDFKKEIIKKIAWVLESQGILFMGNSEIIHDYKDDFEASQYKNCIYYKVKR